MKKYYTLSPLFYLFSANYVLAQSSIQIPTGRALTLTDLLDLGQNLGGFLMIAGSILAGIAIIASGIMYLTSGSNTQRLASAKGTLKAGVIGALIIFGAGLIINTVKIFAQDPLKFFQ